MIFWRRLTRTSYQELAFRAGETIRTAGEAVQVVTKHPHWRREDLVSRLDPAAFPLDDVSRALAAHDWSRADRQLRAYFRQREQRFLINPAARTSVAERVRHQFPLAAASAARRAGQVLEGRFDLLGYRGLSFGPSDAPDWHADPVHDRRAPRRFWKRVPFLDPAFGDHKIIWELNRHQHFLTLGRAAWLTNDRLYADLFARHLHRWMSANQPLVGINWASMLELAFRSLSWLWALHFFSADLADEHDETQPWAVDLLLGLDRQLDHIASHLSLYFSPNTHLLGEALALYVAGLSLPELRGSRRWRDIGRRVLLRETTAQVLPDGGHAELSAHYHRYALDFYLLALSVARVNADLQAEPAFTAVCDRMAGFCRTLADDVGRLPLLGDDDGGMLFPICGRDPADASDSLALAASLLGKPELAVGEPPEEVLWMLGGNASSLVHATKPMAAPPSTRFDHTGYLVLRSPGEHLILDAGPHGFLNGGHAHADALSIVLSVEGVPLLIDPGTATYTMDPEMRDRFRSSAMHNTLVLDGRQQSEPQGPFHWKTRATGSVAVWRPATAFDFVEATHDGYAPLAHRRAVLTTRDRLWLVVDHVLGTGAHSIETYWHLHPAWRSASHNGAAAEFRTAEGSWAALASTSPVGAEVRGDAAGLGWCAPAYGRIEPASVVKFATQAVCPASIVTAIAAGSPARLLRIEPLPVAADGEDGWHRAAVMVSDGISRRIALFTAPLPGTGEAAPRAPSRTVTPEGTLATDARVAVLSLSDRGEPLMLSLVDGQAARWTGDPPATIRLPAPATDLHLDIAAQRRLSRAGEPRRLG